MYVPAILDMIRQGLNASAFCQVYLFDIKTHSYIVLLLMDIIRSHDLLKLYQPCTAWSKLLITLKEKAFENIMEKGAAFSPFSTMFSTLSSRKIHPVSYVFSVLCNCILSCPLKKSLSKAFKP